MQQPRKRCSSKRSVVTGAHHTHILRQATAQEESALVGRIDLNLTGRHDGNVCPCCPIRHRCAARLVHGDPSIPPVEEPVNFRKGGRAKHDAPLRLTICNAFASRQCLAARVPRCSFVPSNVHVPWIAGKEAQALCAVRDGRVMHRGHESGESIDRHAMRDPRLLPSNVLRSGCVVLPGTAAPAKARALVIKSQETCNMKGEAP